MKPYKIAFLIHLFAILLLVSCDSFVEIKEPAPTAAPQEIKPEKKIVLAWGESKQEWTDHLLKETQKFNIAPLDFCTNVKPEKIPELYAQLISIMAKFESGYDPKTSYQESFNDSSGKPVVSRGLLQISIASSNQSAYSCGTKDEQQLHDPLFNLTCATKILNHWTKDKVLFAKPDANLGCGRYWSVCRPLKNGKPRSSYEQIVAYIKALPICAN